MRKIDKKGVEITLNFIVIAAIVLIALIVAILFFTNAADKLFRKETQITQEQLQREISLVEQLCKSHCTFKSQAAYDNPGFSEDLVNSGYKKCDDLPGFDSFEADCSGECKLKEGAIGMACSGLGKDACQANSANCDWVLKSVS